MYDTIIIGGGPAGLTAGIYIQRAGKKALVLEGLAVGGQIRNTPEIENYPAIAKLSGLKFSQDLEMQAKALGVEIRSEEVIGVELGGEEKVVLTASGRYSARTVIIATGAKSRQIGVDRELDLAGSGVSYCAVCDGAFFAGEDVVVAGGGNTAIDDALFLSERCNKVYLVHRRDGFRAEEIKLAQLRSRANVEMVLGYTIDELIGKYELEGVVVKDKCGNARTLKVSGLFVAIGKIPNTSILRGTIDMDDNGYIKANEDCKTNVSGVFVAGDCRTKNVRQLTTAVSDGTIAALSAVEYCR